MTLRASELTTAIRHPTGELLSRRSSTFPRVDYFHVRAKLP